MAIFYLLNSNMGCIETSYPYVKQTVKIMLNSNMGCIETWGSLTKDEKEMLLNSNMGCIETEHTGWIMITV